MVDVRQLLLSFPLAWFNKSSLSPTPIPAPLTALSSVLTNRRALAPQL